MATWPLENWSRRRQLLVISGAALSRGLIDTRSVVLSEENRSLAGDWLVFHGPINPARFPPSVGHRHENVYDSRENACFLAPTVFSLRPGEGCCNEDFRKDGGEKLREEGRINWRE